MHPHRTSITARRITACLIAAGLACAVPAAGAAPVGQASPALATRSDDKAMVDVAFQRWAAGGQGFFDEVLSADVVWTIEGSGPHAVTLYGRDALLEQAVRPLARRMTSPLRPLRWQVWADGDYVIVRWEGAGTARDGALYRNRYVWILRMRDGRAVEVSAFLDLPAYSDLLQRIPEPTAPASPR